MYNYFVQKTKSNEQRTNTSIKTEKNRFIFKIKQKKAVKNI